MNILTKLTVLVAAVTFISAAPSRPSLPASYLQSIKTGVKGSAWATQEDGMTFHTNVNVFQQNGIIKGEMKVQLDLTPFELGIVNFTAKPTCMRFDGATHVYVSGIVTSSNKPDIVPIGAPSVVHVRGLPCGDITNGDLSGTCDSPPLLLETPVTSSDFVIF
ncbi:MAG: hypothetical protein ACM3VS_01080 [Candidatus Dadabacteria bacterium]